MNDFGGCCDASVLCVVWHYDLGKDVGVQKRLLCATIRNCGEKLACDFLYELEKENTPLGIS